MCGSCNVWWKRGKYKEINKNKKYIIITFFFLYLLNNNSNTSNDNNNIKIENITRATKRNIFLFKVLLLLFYSWQLYRLAILCSLMDGKQRKQTVDRELDSHWVPLTSDHFFSSFINDIKNSLTTTYTITTAPITAYSL